MLALGTDYCSYSDVRLPNSQFGSQSSEVTRIVRAVKQANE